MEISPYQIAVYSLSNNEILVNYVKSKLLFLQTHFTVYWDFSSVSIGKKYTRSDSIGVGLTITVDFETINRNNNIEMYDTVTLRYSSDGSQIRIHINDIVKTVNKLLGY